MKQVSIILTVLRLLCLSLLLHTSLAGQELDHVPGSVLVKPSSSIDFSRFSAEISNLIEGSVQTTGVCSAPFDIWMIQFDAAIQNEYRLLEQIRRFPFVEMAQFNHFIKDRLIPDDPQFPAQWQYINTGANGGNPNADLDADLAWDITTGGLSHDGDTIVVCVIDEGLDANHPDLAGNLWYNFAEIPNNNIDDDQNGYVDDYKGWNSVTNTDQLDNGPNAGWHGTPVGGVIGAKGNNSIGVSGVNWNVKIMTVIRGATEASTLAAYSYPCAFRNRYNSTNGAEGAFVVATNSSWGIDFGQPDEAPLWCAFYDSLGTSGILNAAATVNGNYDVDQVGDLPTSCPSDYLISVTNLDFLNQKHPNAGYGVENIDLGAYGTEVWTIKKNASYGSFTGTSAASPSVAGAIALLYAAPCPDISWYAKNNPSAAALLIKEHLLNGTTPIASMQNTTVSGGRLNLLSALNEVMDACAFTACFPPSQIEPISIHSNFALLNWLNATNSSAVELRYRAVGSTNWIHQPNIYAPFPLVGLSPCSEYEYQLRSICNSIESNFSETKYVLTDGCCEAPLEFNIDQINASSISLSWPPSSAIQGYDVRYRPEGGLSWLEIFTLTPQISLFDLNSCTNYELQVKAHCSDSIFTSYSQSYWWQTTACDNCLEYNYCPVSIPGDPFTWISKVTFGDLDHSSGPALNNGYSDYTGNAAMIIPGLFYNISIETDFDIIAFGLYFQVWIDLNQNGIFEDEELLSQNTTPSHTCSTNINIPTNTLTGTTRMRVAARVLSSAPCGDGGEMGEIEDYCITIVENSDCLSPQNINHLSGEGQATISWIGNSWIDEYNIRYREVNSLEWNQITTSFHLISLEDLFPCTDYEYQIQSVCNGENSSHSPLQQFTTLGCGPCLDLDYCQPENGTTSFEWIAHFSLAEIDHTSGADGYANFTGSSADLTKGNTYSMEITPGFSGTTYEEHYTIWIDFNQDGSFDDLSEKVFQTTTATTSENISGFCNIPLTALEGATRLRISMKYYTLPTSGCEGAYFGEVEDYCVSIWDSNTSSGCAQPSDMNILDITSTNMSLAWVGPIDAVAYQLRYRLTNFDTEWTVSTNQNAYCQINNLIECADYEYQVRTICENGLSFYSLSNYFTSACLTLNTEAQKENSFAVFPNPFSNYLMVKPPVSSAPHWQLKLYNSAGILLKSLDTVPTSESFIRLELSDLPSGLYLLKMDDGTTSRVVKVIK